MTTILTIRNFGELQRIMQEIKVDSYGIKIMVPKAITHVARVHSVSNIAANILKQEMLSLGGDVAVARGALTGKAPKTDCLVMGSIAQFRRLKDKLDRQPFGLARIAAELSSALLNYHKEEFVLELGNRRFNTRKKTCIMAVVNLTPDSFSADGLYPRFSMDYILKQVEAMEADGADIIDIGGESSRPGARAVSIKEELSRTIPVIKAVRKRIKAPISIDTYKPEVARQALDNGAAIVNDITGLRDERLTRLVAQFRCSVVVMHMKGRPRTMQQNPVYKTDVIEEIMRFLDSAIQRATAAGIKREKIIIDPGIGFGKTLAHNLQILKRLSEFKVLGQPILVGPSRKSFLGKILNVEPQERLFGTVSACLVAVKNGASIVRVHDVREVRQALDVFEAINKQMNPLLN